MALSDREQKLLEEMERNLYQSEADVVSTDNSSRSKLTPARLLVGTLIVVLGFGVLLVTVVSKIIWLGIVAFALMVFGITWALRRTKADVTKVASPSRFSERLTERWDRRNGDS